MARSSKQATTALNPLPPEVTAAIERAGYYPQLVADVVSAAVADDEVVSHLVHQETTFDADAVRRHVTVAVLTTGRLVIAHADDHAADVDDAQQVATATSETVPLSAVRGVMLTHVVPEPERYAAGSLGREVSLTLGWGAVSRVDLLPATCGDPECEGDHGYDGSITSDDITLRISADADGDVALREALAFASRLSSAIGR